MRNVNDFDQNHASVVRNGRYDGHMLKETKMEATHTIGKVAWGTISVCSHLHGGNRDRGSNKG